MKTKLLSIICMSLLCVNVLGQTFAHQKSPAYVYPKAQAVLDKLDEWQDLKFGMLIHYGLYSYWSVVESWSICSEEEDWIGRDSTLTYDAYKREYWSAIDKFNPEKLNPESWAKYGKKAGMKYAIFTTKHHDGFNLFDTKQTDFSIAHGAFKNNPRYNIAKEVFKAFSNEGFMVGAYYSKPDWHCQYYWWDRYATPTRSQNYSILKNPWRWNKFQEFCYNQIEELMNGDYGNLDILWLDGGWVYPMSEERAKQLGRAFKGSPDINLPKIAAMARSYQPGLLVVDRTIPGEFENYQTPERGIPECQLTNPWESCIPLGNDWGFTHTDIYKSPNQVIHILAEIVAKGGNLLLGIGPKPDGTLPIPVEERLEKIGEWMDKNGEAIFNTTITTNYTDGDRTWFTKSKDGKFIYAIYCLEEGNKLPSKISFKGNLPKKKGKVVSLQTGKAVSYIVKNGAVNVKLPGGLPKDIAALAFSLEVE